MYSNVVGVDLIFMLFFFMLSFPCVNNMLLK